VRRHLLCLDRFIRLRRALACAQRTDIQTMERATRVAVGRSYAMYAMRPVFAVAYLSVHCTVMLQHGSLKSSNSRPKQVLPRYEHSGNFFKW